MNPPLVLYDHRASICSQMARLALVEKQLAFERHAIDIMDTSEQFEPWYVALNPRAVVPTLTIGDEVVVDTIAIVNRLDTMDGPDLSGDDTAQDWLKAIMALHYGVLLYRNRLDADGTAPQIMARGAYLRKLEQSRPDLGPLIAARLDGNKRFQALLKDPQGIIRHVADAFRLIDDMAKAVTANPFLAGSAYSVADCFATAALARFSIHGFTYRWRAGPLDDYYCRMKARSSFKLAEVIDTGSERDL